jgi:hypothetical protein
MGYQKLTPKQVQAEIEAGTSLYVADDYYPRLETSAIVTRVTYFGNTLLGVGRYKARIFVREDEISDETWYTLDTSSRIKVYRKSDFDREED